MNSQKRFLSWFFSRLRRRDWFNVILIYHVFYLLIILVSFYSISRIHQIGGQPIVDSPRLFSGLFKWDAINYLYIARNDYPKFSSLSAFMPLYPYLSYHLSNILHISIQSSMMLLSYFSGLLSMGLIYVLSNRFFIEVLKRQKAHASAAKHQNIMTSNKQKNINHSSHYDDYKKYSFMTIIAFAAFPTSFVLILPYADSLFIALTLATILLALKRKWGLAAVLASLTVITKPLGIIIMVFLIIEYLRSIKFNLKNINRNIAFSIFPIIALGVYLYWANYKFGNAIAFYNSQSNINRYFDPNLNFIWVWLRELFLLIELAFKQKYIETFLNEMGYFLSWTIAFYAVLRLMRLRVMSLSLSLYFIALLLAMIYGGNFVSVNRYVVIVIPLFWYLTLRLEHSSALKYFILILSLCFWVMNIVLFSNGFWVF